MSRGPMPPPAVLACAGGGRARSTLSGHRHSAARLRTVSTMAARSGTMTPLRVGLYGAGATTPFNRWTGASRSRNACSMTCVAISAPTPHGPKSSSTISSKMRSLLAASVTPVAR
jgi:hypothetical protein